MRQIWIPRFGGPDVFQVKEAPDPTPANGEVRIRVKASGVNFADVMARLGLYPDAPPKPMVVGYEVAGIIDAVGAGVKGYAVGDRVYCLCRFGGYSDVVCVPEVQAVKMPASLSFEKAAAIPVNYLTAWIMLVHIGNLHKGERVLIHAAAGGVGVAAVQIARWRGAEIFGTASASKHERLRSMGVAHCIDYHSQDFEAEIKRITGGKGVHVAVDAVGGKSFGKSYRSLAPLGRLFMFGASSIATGEKRNVIAALRGLLAMKAYRPVNLMNDNKGVFGVNMGHLWDHGAEMHDMLVEMRGLVEQGVLDPQVDKTFSFDKVGEAHSYLQAHKNFGKVLLTP